MESRNGEIVAGLKQLAEFIEANPDVDFATHMAGSPVNMQLNAWYATGQEINWIKMMARRMGNHEKEYTESFLYLRKTFGQFVKIVAVTSREQVCERVVIGKKVVPATAERVIPQQVIAAQPEREEEIFEYRCTPLLAPVPSVVDMSMTAIQAPECLALPQEVADEIPF